MAKIQKVCIFSIKPETHIAFCPIFVHPLFLCLNPTKKSVFFVRRRPLTFQNVGQSFVRVCVKASRAEGLTFPNVTNDAGQTISPCF